MNVARRIRIGAVLALVLGGTALALAGAVAAFAGVELPKGLDGVLASAADFVGWLRVAVVAVLAFGVMRVRE